MNKRDLSIIKWCEDNRKDLVEHFQKLLTDEAYQGPQLVAGIAFEAGRQFQDETKEELNNPNIYL